MLKQWNVCAALLSTVGIGIGVGVATSAAEAHQAKAAAGKLTTATFVNPLPTEVPWATTGKCMAQQASKSGVTLTQTGPTGSANVPTTMISEIQQAAADGTGAIITLPASPAFAPLLKQEQAKGIITVTFYGASGKGSGATTNVGPSWAQLGRLYVAAVAKRKGPQNIGLITQSNTGLSAQWMAGIRAAAAKTKNVKVVASVYDAGDSAQALPEMTDLLTAHPNINVVESNDGLDNPAAIALFKSKHLIGKDAFVGNGSANGGIEALNDGVAPQMLMQPQCGFGKLALAAAVADADGIGKAQVNFKSAMATEKTLHYYLTHGWS